MIPVEKPHKYMRRCGNLSIATVVGAHLPGPEIAGITGKRAPSVSATVYLTGGLAAYINWHMK